MSTWEERFVTCMHGVTEGVDYFHCSECREICEKKDCTCIEHNDAVKREISKVRHIWFEQPQ